LLIFIFLANNLSFFPGLGSPSQDINTPLTLALLVFVAVHYFGFKEKGVLRYLKDSTSPIIIFPFEVISQISRTVSLTLRLFGNIISTELIVAIISQLVPVGAPILMIALSLLTGTLQAYIFTALAGSYISNAVQQNET
jgi:F-type H+-transporting ATPase subunit a